MPLLDDVSSVFRGISNVKRKQAFDQQKLQIEAEKLNIKSAEVASKSSHLQAQDSLAAAKARELAYNQKKIQTENLGVQLDNVGKKIDNFQKLQNPWGEVGPSLELDNVGKKTDRGISSFRGIETQPTKQNVPPAQGGGGPAQSIGGPAPSLMPGGGSAEGMGGSPGFPQVKGSVSQMLMPKIGGGFGGEIPQVPGLEEIPLPPQAAQLQDPTVDISRATSAMKDYTSSLQAGAKEMTAQREKLNIINEERNKGVKQVQDFKFRLGAEYEKLAKNPPTRKRAINDISWGQKLGAFAMLLMETKSPIHMSEKSVWEDMVEKKMNDLKIEHDARKGFLDKADNLYSQFYDITKDDFEAELATKTALRQNISDVLSLQSSRVQNEEGLVKIQQQQKEIMNDNLKDQDDIYSNRWSKVSEAIGKNVSNRLEYWEKRAETSGSTMGADLKPHQVKQLQESLRLGSSTPGGRPTMFLDVTKQQADIVRKSERDSSMVLHDIPRLRTIADDLGIIDLGAIEASRVAGKMGDATRAKYETLDRTLQQLMLQQRIRFTGGGNMNRDELNFLRAYHEVAKEGFLPSSKFRDMLKKKWKGNYKTLFNLMERISVNNFIHDAKAASGDFKALGEAEQFNIALDTFKIDRSDKKRVNRLRRGFFKKYAKEFDHSL